MTSRTTRRFRNGYTLIELIVVLTIMAVLMAVAGFVFGGSVNAEAEAKSLARRLGGTMEDAQRNRQLHGSFAWLEYDFANQTIHFYIERELESGETIADIRDHPEDYMQEIGGFTVGDPDAPETSHVWLDSVQTFDGDRYRENSYMVTFDPDGSAVGHIVYISYLPEDPNAEREFVSVELNPVTGIASVFEFFKGLEKGRVP